MREKNKITISYDPITEQNLAESRARVLACQGYSIKPIKTVEGQYQKIVLVRYDTVGTANA